MAIHLGIDLGSVSVKAAAFSADPAELPVMERLASDPGSHVPRRIESSREGAAWLAVVGPRRITGNPIAQAGELLRELVNRIDGADLGGIVATGSGARMLEQQFGTGRTNEFRALAYAAELLLPGVLTLFEIGGENSRYMRMEPHGGNGQLGIADYQTNGDCAAGTGTFLDQQAGRLRFRVEDIGRVALSTPRAAQIAGRCSVFAKSDMVHAQQRGFTPEEILKGLCEAVARNFRTSVVSGRSIEGTVGFVGGVAANPAVVRALEEAFGWLPGALTVPPDHASFAAIGAAVAAHRNEHDRSPEKRRLSFRGFGAVPESWPTAPPLTMGNVLVLRDRMAAVPVAKIEGVLDAFLGIDIGSVSTNLVVMDSDSRVLTELYLRTDGRPIAAVSHGLQSIQRTLGAHIRICGVGTTGSGRELIGELVGADTVRDEITAHKTGSAFIDDALLGLGVDTIFEIGGQDAKFISVRNGVVVDFAMNEACAAGTGSFLEECARELGIRIEGEFASLALSSPTAVHLGERCTVFMERDVKDWLRRGAAKPSVVAGLAYSVATNYINRVVRGRQIGDVIFFQGGTAYNDAVAAALSLILGKRIIVPPFNGVLGALGAALLARQKIQATGASTRFRGLVLDNCDCKPFEFTCRACTNQCQMQRFTIDGEHTYWGDKCSVRYRKRSRHESAPVIDDLVSHRQEQLLAGYDPAAGDGPVVGIPFCMSTYEWAPFWLAVFRELGLRVLLSEPTANDVVKLGLEATVSMPCFPIQVAHGHVRWLLDHGADFVFVPNNVSATGDLTRRPSFFCPWQQTLPFVARAAPFIFERRDRLLAPTLWFNEGAAAVANSVRQSLSRAGLARPAKRVRGAIAGGFEALSAFRASLHRAGKRALDSLEQAGADGVLLLGRPYNMYDKGINLDIATKLRRYYGANVIGFDYLDVPADEVLRYEGEVFWTYGARLLAAAAFARSRSRLHVVYITNFNCGPDSFIKHHITEALGRPFLTLQFDGHNNDAGVLTRCEAYLDSKGVLR